MIVFMVSLSNNTKKRQKHPTFHHNVEKLCNLRKNPQIFDKKIVEKL